MAEMQFIKVNAEGAKHTSTTPLGGTLSERVEVELPFSGFYESWHSDEIDRALEMDLNGIINGDDATGELDHDAPEAEYLWNGTVDYRAIEREYCKEYAQLFGTEFDLECEFIEMTSPREYNFATDRLFVSVPREQMDAIRHRVEAMPEWPSIVKDRFTSYDGFASHYSNDSTKEVWTRDTLDECQYRVMLEVIAKEWLDDKMIYVIGDMEIMSFDSSQTEMAKVYEIVKHRCGYCKTFLDPKTDPTTCPGNKVGTNEGLPHVDKEDMPKEQTEILPL